MTTQPHPHAPAAPLTTQGKKALKQKAFTLKPIILLGQKGLTDAVHAEIDLALDAHELIKIRMTGVEREDYAAHIAAICGRHQATQIARIGKVLTIYRKRMD